MLAQLLALAKQLGPQFKLVVAYLIANKDQIAGLVALLSGLFGHAGFAGQEVTAEQVSAECVACGCSEADAAELLASVPE